MGGQGGFNQEILILIFFLLFYLINLSGAKEKWKYILNKTKTNNINKQKGKKNIHFNYLIFQFFLKWLLLILDYLFFFFFSFLFQLKWSMCVCVLLSVCRMFVNTRLNTFRKTLMIICLKWFVLCNKKCF